jgi:hypothetical protein
MCDVQMSVERAKKYRVKDGEIGANRWDIEPAIEFTQNRSRNDAGNP